MPRDRGTAGTHHRRDAVNDSDKALVRTAIAETLRQVAEWGQLSTLTDEGVFVGLNIPRAELIALADTVETGDPTDWWSCPLCEETECDLGCPLYSIRSDT